MKSTVKLGLIGLSFLLTGCAHSLHQVHTSDFQPYAGIERGEIVSGRSEQFVIMGFVQNTDYVEEAYRNLMAACPNGMISGITTQYSTSLGFLSWRNKILAQGQCIPAAAANSRKRG